MMKKRLFQMAALLLLGVVLLSSCSAAEIEPEKDEKNTADPLTVQVTWYVTQDGTDTDGFSISASDSDALCKQAQECIRIMQSEEFLDKVRRAVGNGISHRELRHMTEISSATDTAVIALTIASDQHTKEQLQKIADAYIDVASIAIDEAYLGTVRLVLIAKEMVE